MKRLIAALVISIVYLILGNAVSFAGLRSTSDSFLNAPIVDMLFAPYGFIVFAGSFAGYDPILFVFEGMVFIVTIPFFYGFLTVAEYSIIKVRGK